jgi:Flp pilus assembly CpaE family ATPase
LCVYIFTDIVDDVVQGLFPDLQKGSTLLHALNSISRKAKKGDETSRIISQTTNTFPSSLDFPKEEHVFISPTFSIEGGGQTKSFEFDVLKKNLKNNLRGDFNLVCSIDPTRKSERQTIVSVAPGMGKSEVTRELAKWLEYSTDHLVVLLQISSLMQFFLREPTK